MSGTPRVPTGRHPAGEYAVAPVSPRTQTPQGSFASMAAEVSAIEHLITEALVAQERRLMLRLETASKAQESAALTMARRSARRRGALATTLGVAAGTMLAVFATAWTTYRDTREIASKAAEQTAEQTATEVVTAKAAPVEIRASVTDVRVHAIEERQAELYRRVDGLGAKLDAVLERLPLPPKPRPR